MIRRYGAAALVMITAACASTPPATTEEPQPQPPAASPAPTPAPWNGPMLSSAAVPSAYVAEWRKAANRDSCALIAPADLGVGRTATARAATFSGGWAVAYDMPDVRSAFGIAGTGSRASDPSYDAWPHRIQFADGSTAGYGPEGGTGPNQLAYLRIAGQTCLYNVWSRFGRTHLETLLSDLRFVRP